MREAHADAERSKWANTPELEESSVTATPEARAHLTVLKEALRAQEWRDKAMLAETPFTRFNEEWFANHPNLFPPPRQPNGRGGRTKRRRK